MRLFAVWLAWAGEPFGDAARYLQLAASVALTLLLALRMLPLPSHSPAGPMWAVYPPGYPVLLAGWSALFPLNAASLAAFNSLFDLIAAYLLAGLAREAGMDRAAPWRERPHRAAGAAPWVGLAYLCWPAAAFSVPLAEKESLEAMLVLAITATILQLSRQVTLPGVALAGLVAAGLVLAQPSLALLPPLLFVLVRTRFERPVEWRRAALLSGFVAIALMTPWWARNYAHFGQLVPLTSSGGRSLWVGSLPGGGSAWHPYPPDWANLSELDFDGRARAAALATIAADPLGWLARCLLKFPASYLRPHYALGVLALLRPSPWPELFGHRLLLLIPSAIELVVTLFALYAAARFRRSLASRLFIAMVAYLLVVTIWFEFSERHRAYLAPFALLAAAQLIVPPKPRPSGNELPSGAL